MLLGRLPARFITPNPREGEDLESQIAALATGLDENDAFVIFPALRAMHTGDAFPNKGMPIMDINNGGSGVAYADTIAKAASVPNIDTVITGHNQTVVTTADVQMYSEFVRDFVTAVRAAKKGGQSIDDVVNSWKLPDRYLQAGYAQPPAARLRPNVEVLWKELN